MNNKQRIQLRATEEATRIRRTFWEEFDRALQPKNASKQTYLEQLEELAEETKGRIECVKVELAREGESF